MWGIKRMACGRWSIEELLENKNKMTMRLLGEGTEVGRMDVFASGREMVGHLNGIRFGQCAGIMEC